MSRASEGTPWRRQVASTTLYSSVVGATWSLITLHREVPQRERERESERAREGESER